MLLIQQALLLSDVSALQQEITCRRDLSASMVGNLYPSILINEILALQERKYNIQYGSVAPQA